ncbi:MAG: DNA repair protein RecO [Devosiaceae bacterium]|nr:DNA repair protein RecO [Devosiaceae bacterium MH13]
MEWTASAIVLATRKHSEANVIVEVMTRDRGRHLGLVRGGRSRRMAPLLQVGNTLHMVWRARLDEHLGTFTVDAERLIGADLMARPLALNAIQLCAAHLRLLPERDPHARLHDLLSLIVETSTQPDTRDLLCALVARFELLLLEELGFGLDLERCASTGQADQLVYVSPKSGRAVSNGAGEPYKDRLLPLPAFLRGSLEGLTRDDLAGAFQLTGHFLERDVWAPRGVRPPDARQAVLSRAGSRASALP